MCANMDVIGATNANKGPQVAYNPFMEFFQKDFHASVVYEAMKKFNLQTMDDPPEAMVPDMILNGDRHTRSDWLHSRAAEIVDQVFAEDLDVGQDTEGQGVLEVLLLEMSETDQPAAFKDDMEGELVTWLKGEVKRKRPSSGRQPPRARVRTKRTRLRQRSRPGKSIKHRLSSMLRDSYPPKPLKADQLVDVAFNTGLVSKVRTITEDNVVDVFYSLSYSGDEAIARNKTCHHTASDLRVKCRSALSIMGSARLTGRRVVSQEARSAVSSREW
ncbi:Hypp8246 [Branchiostoma lanceolatum]|uniref:Hypp8246 protein n=1 Tax=Branchiostoma lanceolatum TaxID=7740 RepID=A0A8K0EHG1_BRALA|nr:Hypp8246 [Branchiostoma lanceolatum]